MFWMLLLGALTAVWPNTDLVTEMLANDTEESVGERIEGELL